MELDEDQLVLEYPSLGIFNYDKVCVYVGRRAARVYKRGVLTDYLGAQTIPEIRNSNRLPVVRSNDPTLLQELYNPTYFDMEEAVGAVYSGERAAAAISPELAMVASATSPDVSLVYKTTPVGVVKDDGAIEFSRDVVRMRPTIERLIGEANAR
jgi:hypothetical protein